MQVIQNGTGLVLNASELQAMLDQGMNPVTQPFGEGGRLLKLKSTAQADWWARRIANAVRVYSETKEKVNDG